MEGEDGGVGRGARGRGGGQVVISAGVQAEMRPEMMNSEARSHDQAQRFMMHFKSLKVLYCLYK